MKRRNLILSFVVIALLLIGVGFAAISDNLDVEADVATDYAELDLYFSAASATYNDVEDTLEEKEHDALESTQNPGDQIESEELGAGAQKYVNLKGDKAVLTVSNMAHQGDQVVFVLTISNRSAANDMTAKFASTNLTVVWEDADQSYFTATAVLSADEVAVGETVTLTITVTLEHSISQAGISGSFTVDLTGTYKMEHEA